MNLVVNTVADPLVAPGAASLRGRPPLDVVWAALATVPDPEVPVVSIVELGIVRSVAWNDGRLVVKVTPTYSGCPATELINELIRESLAVIGVTDVLLVNQLAPAWTTDWIAPEAKVRLKGFGIAPPHVIGGRVDVSGISPLRRAKVAVPCPRCNSTNTQLLSQFGSTACKAQYRCLDCREPFDYFKPH
ncbi:MAG: 1,2-phenylacetyl-CoA epoxidase subunit PaaD [Betaproteobacteria bacterium]